MKKKKATQKTTGASTPISDYSMQDEFERPKLPTGEYSGIAPNELAGVPETKTVRYDLQGGAAGAASSGMMVCEGGVAPQADLSEEFAERDSDLDPQYIWRGKRRGDLNALEVKAPIIYQQEKIFPRTLIEDLRRRAAKRKIEEYQHDASESGEGWIDTLPGWDKMKEEEEAREASFYHYNQGWKNRMILGDSLPVMASLAENEQLRGKVQMIYFDPPYGIKFNSNWQPSTKSTNVKDGAASDITREPEMVKAFRDTWHDGIHSYLGYLRDRLVVARDLLAESGSCFVQIGDANVHKVRAIMEEVFGEENFVCLIPYVTTTGFTSTLLPSVFNYVLWAAKNKANCKYRSLFVPKNQNEQVGEYKPAHTMSVLNGYPIDQSRLVQAGDLTSQGASAGVNQAYRGHGKAWLPPASAHWKTSVEGLTRLDKASRIVYRENSIRYLRFFDDFPVVQRNNCWDDTGTGVYTAEKIYVVQTGIKIIARCMLMTTDPGDLVLDPTCGSGTTAYVAEQWGRRWITIDTSRVALALARQRLMTAKFPYYLLLDSPEGLKKETEVTGKFIDRPTYGKVSQGFVYERVPHITLKGIANDAEIDLIWEKYAAESERLRRIMGGAKDTGSEGSQT